MNVIDIEKLEGKVYQSDGSVICMCPACAENGQNLRSKSHLRVWPTGQFNCVVATGDKAHNARILQLVGTESNGELPEIQRNIQPKIEIPVEYDLSILKSLIKNYSYFESRGISAETQKFFKMGVAGKGKLNQRVVIPIENERHDKIVGFTGRLIDDKNEWHIKNKTPKYKHLLDIGSCVFPYFPNEIKKAKNKIILVEGPGDVLYLWDRGIKNVICLFGVNISSKVLGYLIQLNPEEILIATNNELNSSNKGVGNKSAEKIRGKLLNFFNEEKVKIALPQLKDFLDFWTKGEDEEQRLLNEWIRENL